MEQWKWKVETAKAYREMLLQYDWQWFCSLNLSAGSDYSKAEDRLKGWRITMGIKDRIWIAYMGVYNTIPQPHVHLLVWGKRNESGQTLLDLNHKNWERAWSGITHRDAVIEPIYERKRVASYIADKNLPWDRSELIQPYQKRLLRKVMIR